MYHKNPKLFSLLPEKHIYIYIYSISFSYVAPQTKMLSLNLGYIVRFLLGKGSKKINSRLFRIVKFNFYALYINVKVKLIILFREIWRRRRNDRLHE